MDELLKYETIQRYEDDINLLFNKYNKGISFSTIYTIYHIVPDYDKCVEYIDNWLEIHKFYCCVSERDMVAALRLARSSMVDAKIKEIIKNTETIFESTKQEVIPNSKRWKMQNKNKFHK